MPSHHNLISAGSSTYAVLILAGDSIDRDWFQHHLLSDSRGQYLFLEADSVAAAVTLCQNAKVDAVFIDSTIDSAAETLPESIRELQSHLNCTLPILVLGSQSDPAVVVQAMKAGAEDYLLKQTLTPEQLQNAVRSAIHSGRHQLQQQMTNCDPLEVELNQRIADLQQQQQQLQRLIEIIPVGIGIATDPSCSQMQHNAYLRQLLGVQPGRNISKSAPAEEQPDFRVLQNGEEVPAEDLPMQLAARSGVEVQGSEIEIVWPDGNVRHLLSYASPIRDEHDQINGAIGAFLDITDRKRIETALRESHEQLTNTLESITDAFFSLDQNWQFTFVNPQAAKLLHKSPAELVGKSIWTVFTEAVDTEFDVAYRRAVAEQVTVQFEAFYPPLDTWFEVRAYPTREGLAVYFQDVTSRKAAETRLRESEERLRLALQATGLGIWDWDVQRNQVTWAGENEKLFGLAEGSFTGTYEAFLNCVHPEDREAVQQCVANALAEKRGYVQEFGWTIPMAQSTG